jgi:hypothetical protein
MSSQEYRGSQGIQNSNYQDYKTNNCYNSAAITSTNGTPIPYYGTVKPGVQVVPSFKGFDYINPNYDSLTLGACANNYGTINDTYVDDNKGCVTYIPRPCPKAKGKCL